MISKKYPVQLSRKDYGGRDAKKRNKIDEHNRLCTRVEAYVNAQIESWPDANWRTIGTYEIAKKLGAEVEAVSDALDFDNGITCGR